MQRHFFSLRIAALVILAGIVVAAIDLGWRGFAVIHDPAGRLAGASLAGEGASVPFRVMTAGYWVARPGGIARVILRCRSGVRTRAGDTAPGERFVHTVTADDCRPAR